MRTLLCRVLPVIVLLVTSVACRPRADSALRNAENPPASTLQVINFVNQMTDIVRRYRLAQTEDSRLRIKAEGQALVGANANLLRPALAYMLDVAPQAQTLSPLQKDAIVEQAAGIIETEASNTFEPWSEMDDKLMERVNSTTGDSLPAVLAKLGKQEFVAFDGKILIDGPQSWPERNRLIESATKSIWIFCWAFYDDKTGQDVVKQLMDLKRSKPNLDIRIVVDGPTSLKPTHDPIMKRFLTGDGDDRLKIPVIRWDHRTLKGFGMHRKMIIVDHEIANPSSNATAPQPAVIFGGMNYGDEYSHKHPDGVAVERIHEWRDTDMLVRGEAVQQAARIFADAWNRSVAVGGRLTQQQALSRIELPPAGRRLTPSRGDLFAFVDHEPSRAAVEQDYLDPIYLVTLKMIESAKTSIDISNAYYIVTAPIQNALARALQRNRNLKIRVHTNSDTSLCTEDKPLLGPIYKSLDALLSLNTPNDSRATVLLQQERTLHSKYMVVDEQYGWIGSYNIHPRSSRYEGENIGIFYSPTPNTGIAKKVQEMFDEDARVSRPVTEITVPQSQLFDVLETLFFEQL